MLNNWLENGRGVMKAGSPGVVGLGFRVSGLGLRVEGLGFRVLGLLRQLENG